MNISNLVQDWGGFEKLVAKLNETGDVEVEHNVTLTGKSGAPRQIDVLIRHKQGLIEHLVVVECKYWNRSVERQNVDAFITTVQEVNASRGVIFTTKGYQSGAITQAEHNNIDLFKVRSLKDEEWGLPGQVVDLFLHINSIAIGEVELADTYSLSGFEPTNTSIAIDFGGPNSAPTNTSINWKGKPYKTLEEMMQQVAIYSAQKAYSPTKVQFENGFNGKFRFKVNVNIEPENPIEVFLQDGYIFIPRMKFSIGVTVSQSRLVVDRAKSLMFCLAVEDCIKQTITLASRPKDDKATTLRPYENEDGPSEDVFKNGSILSVWLKGNHPFDDFIDMEVGKAYLENESDGP